MRFVFIPPVGVALVCVLGLTSCGKKESATPTTPKETAARSVRVATVTTRPMERVLQVVGTLSAREEATIAAQVAGQLEKNLVDLGDVVTAGQEIALIDTTAYEALANAAAANLTRAQASAANAAQNLKRVQELQRAQIASTSDLDAAVAEAARTQAEVKAAEANDAIAKLNLERSRVRAPFNGMIAARIASAGDYLGVGAAIVRMVQADPLRLRLDVPERDSGLVRVGQPVRVFVEGDTNIYRGELARVAPAIRESNRMLAVQADVPNPGGLRVGLFARAQIVVAQQEPVLSVPAAALLTFAGLQKVVLVNAGKAAEINVTTGRRENGWVEISAGLTGGEIVVLEPTGLRTGQPLIVSDAAAAPVAGLTNTSR